MTARSEAIERAARELLDRLTFVHADPNYIAVWTMAQWTSGRQYTGPTYTDELIALRAALALAPSPPPSDATGGGHEPKCYYLRSSDHDGDEAARCDCAKAEPSEEYMHGYAQGHSDAVMEAGARLSAKVDAVCAEADALLAEPPPPAARRTEGGTMSKLKPCIEYRGVHCDTGVECDLCLAFAILHAQVADTQRDRDAAYAAGVEAAAQVVDKGFACAHIAAKVRALAPAPAKDGEGP